MPGSTPNYGWSTPAGGDLASTGDEVIASALTDIDADLKAVSDLVGGPWTVVDVDDDYTIVANLVIVRANATDNDIEITASNTEGFLSLVKRVDGVTANTVTIVGPGGVDGGNVQLTDNFQARGFAGNGVSVDVIFERKPFGDDVAPLGGAETPGDSGNQARSNHAHDITLSTTPVAASGTTQALDMEEFDQKAWDITLTDDCTLSITGWLANRQGWAVITFRQDGTGGHALTLPAADWDGGYDPVIPLTADAEFALVFFTPDGGTTIKGRHGQVLRKHTLHQGGALTAATMKPKEPFPWAARIVRVEFDLGTAPVSTATVLDAKIDGSRIWTTTGNRPSMAAGNTEQNTVTLPDVVLITPGQRLQGEVITASSAADLDYHFWTLEVQ